MLLSLLPTLVCLSLINGGLYALHLTGGTTSNSNSNNAAAAASSSLPSSSASLININAGSGGNNHHHNVNNKNGNMLLSSVASASQQQQHSSHPPGGGGIFSGKHFEGLTHPGSTSNFGEQIADMAQLERERLMLMELAKQTAAAGNAATSHHGRPIVTGRIQMTPADMEDDSGGGGIGGGEYPSILLQQAARNFMFGNVVKQAAPHYDYDSAEDYDGAIMPRHYEYGHIVQPPLERHHFLAPATARKHEFDDFIVDAADVEADDDAAAAAAFDLDMDAFGDEDVEEALPDIDGYQYLDELLAEQQILQQQQHQQQQKHDWQQHQPQHFLHAGGSRQQPHSFHGFDELADGNPQPHALQELFEQEQQKQQHNAKQQPRAAGGATAKNGKQHYDIRMQQKWQRKRAQQQQQQREHQQKFFNNHQRLGQSRAQQQHFGLHPSSNNKLTLANALNAEAAAANAAATNKQQQHSSSASSSSSSAATKQQTTDHQSANAAASTSSSGNGNAAATKDADAAKSAANGNNKLNQQQQQQQQHQQHIIHPNHKRSGIGAGTMQSPQPAPPSTHSIASQLMMRSARGQRQYDVPQIECPTAMDGMERFACPTPDLQGRYRCIDDHVLCDGFIDCPEGEDEDRSSCMFYKTTKAHLDVLADALLRWARGR